MYMHIYIKVYNKINIINKNTCIYVHMYIYKKNIGFYLKI